MKSQYLKDKFGSITKAIDKARSVSVNDPELVSMLSAYLIVLISGTYEDCIEHLFVQRALKSGDKELKNFVEKLIGAHFRNPHYERIKKWINFLNPLYGEKLDSKINTKEREGINSIYTNRIDVAHYGKALKINLNDVTDYHSRSIKIFNVLENILL